MAAHSHWPPFSRPRHWPTDGGPATIAIALALFVSILALRLGDPKVVDSDEVLAVLPITLLALQFGLPGGLVGALLGLAIIGAWDYQSPVGLSIEDYLCWTGAFLLLGTMLGTVVDHRRRLEAVLANNAELLETKVAERTRELEVSRGETLQRLARAAEYRDDDTSQHTQRVGLSAAGIGRQLGLGADQIELLREAAPLHDVGKLAISDAILLNPGKLTAQEYEVMKTHTTLGARLLSGSSSPVLQMAAVIAASHHERWDGAGYPGGLAGEVIPLVARIVAVADVFDALTHDRPYKSAWSVEEAISEIQRGAGSQFDARVVRAFLATHAAAGVGVMRACVPVLGG
jgi:HD domain